MPIDEASRQNNIPPGFTIRQVPRSIASNCASPSAKCRTALLMTTSANASGNVMRSIGSWRKLSAGRCGASATASRRTV